MSGRAEEDAAPSGMASTEFAHVDVTAELRACAAASRAAAVRLAELPDCDPAVGTAALDCADICAAALAVYSRIPQGRAETVYAIWVAVQQAAGVCAELTYRYARGDDVLARCLTACQRTEHAADGALRLPPPPPVR